MKARRHATILRILRERPVETQDELLQELRREGIEVTQATISRDIKELRLLKIPTGDGRYRYAVPRQPMASDVLQRARRALSEYVTGLDWSSNLLIVKTLSGTANAVAAVLDELQWPEVVGTVAGDDSILVVVRERLDPVGPPPPLVERVADRIEELRGRGASE